MRTITNSVTSAFLANRAFKSGNDESYFDIDDNVTYLKLHGHIIAKKQNNRLFITNCGYFTNVTKERLNGLPNVRIAQKKGIWYLNGKEWDGNLIEIKPTFVNN